MYFYYIICYIYTYYIIIIVDCSFMNNGHWYEADFFALDFETTGLTRKELPRILEISLESIPVEKLTELQAPPPAEGAAPSNIDPQSQCNLESPTATPTQYYSLIDPGIPSSVSFSFSFSPPCFPSFVDFLRFSCSLFTPMKKVVPWNEYDSIIDLCLHISPN